ncbi:thiamine phosphate synthase [Campylobacter corcagiensis]|uniref:Thiamine phosphate synthase n=1 Tax=Campylobacter corcagiensis TaxID=1448857 RepID=A0A7M1LES9_9BACT|nr:thiamine phosphate synthase [Campylobacter corcagiensis]QKF64779.1 thiamine phosphate synthase (TMP-TENI domain) [Campylobacter corcagiensis]QOQ87058.1 thiamine phosphate synthase [Campylobacter corcagiensis]
MNIVFVTNSQLSSQNLTQILKTKTGFNSVILRENLEYYNKFGTRIIEICKLKGVNFITHNFTNFAIQNSLKSIHFSFLNFKNLDKQILKNFSQILVSVHSIDELKFAKENGATAVIYGNIFKTDSHPKKPGVGMDSLINLTKQTDLDVYAIGGINSKNLDKFSNLDIAGICMMREFML